MEHKNYARHAFIILWVLWTMLCVRFGYRIGLIGFHSHAGEISTVLFSGLFCALIPFSLLLSYRKNNTRWLIWTSVFLCTLGIAALLVFDHDHIYIASSLLATGSALLTASFFHIYVYGLKYRQQVLLIVAFLIAKPVFSLAAMFVSDSETVLPYAVLAALVLASIAVCGRFINAKNNPDISNEEKMPIAAKTPFWTFTGVYALFALIVFEKMNCTFTLALRSTGSPSVFHYFYFAGGFIMALFAYWLFVRKNKPVSITLEIFLFTAIIHFIFSIASENGLLPSGGYDMMFFGISDIIYIFLFVTAASLSTLYRSKKVFMGFVFVFSISIFCAFAFSRYLYIRYQSIYTVAYSLISLAMIAACILMAPLFRKLNMKPAENLCERSSLPQEISIGPDKLTKAQLTVRENEIVDLYLKGYSNQQVCEMLHIAPATIKVHCRNIYGKLSIKSRLELHYLYHFNKNDDIL